jgi:ATP-binding cassette subfamily F protein uup
LNGEIEPDLGQFSLTPGAKVRALPQDVPKDLCGNIHEVVGGGVRPSDWPAGTDEHEIEWQTDHQIKQILSRMELDGARRFESLSSGMKRRVLLARALVSAPDLLLLDEPTNHLDIDAINWLEEFLSKWEGTYIFVTHDRMFLRKLARRILEIDRGRLFDWSCDYETFLLRKETALAAEEKQNALFDKKLAQEEVWIRQGIKARRTRNEGRVRALESMRRTRRERVDAPAKVQLQIQEGARSGALIAEVDQVSFGYAERPILERFSTTIMRGDRIGIIGPNGAGKTTLLRILLGKLAPQSGRVRLGTNLQIAYFDQLREQLDEDKSVQENVGDGYDNIQMNGQSRHVIGYLQDFLFSPERARSLVRFLSGGERNRILLAKLFAKPANVIVLDEPTNDLDAETLELLEERLSEFEGTVLLVSHDRAFLNNVVGSTIVFEPEGVKEYVGGYDDWLRQRTAAGRAPRAGAKRETPRGLEPDKPAKGAAGESARSSPAPGLAASTPAKKGAGRRLSFKEQQELASLPERIEQLETELAALHRAFGEPQFYQQSGEQIAQEQSRLKQRESDLKNAYDRWEELAALAK